MDTTLDRSTPAATRLAALQKLVADALPRRAGPGIIVGPSHAVRWRHATANGVLPPPYDDPTILGEGGFPVWNRSIFGQVYRNHEVGVPIFLILPDFRFGNSLFDASGPVCGQLYNGHTHIERALIRPDVDAVMYRHHVENLTIWRSLFGRDLAIFDWTTLMTAVEHRSSERYVTADGVYENRAYAEWVRCDRQRLGARSWPEALVTRDAARLRRLMVDRSLHPSATGFFLLHHMLMGASFSEALAQAETLWDQILHALNAQLAPVLADLGPVALSGEASWFTTASRLLGPSGRAGLAEIGLYMPQAKDPRSPARDLPPGALHIRLSDAIETPDPGNGSAPRPYVFSWGAFARATVFARHADNAHLEVPDLETLTAATPAEGVGRYWLGQMLAVDNPETFVDAGSDLSPTYLGMAMVLLSLTDSLRILRKA